jgi:hypothetical protein
VCRLKRDAYTTYIQFIVKTKNQFILDFCLTVFSALILADKQ